MMMMVEVATELNWNVFLQPPGIHILIIPQAWIFSSSSFLSGQQPLISKKQRV